MTFRDLVQAPDLPALERQSLEAADGELRLNCALVEQSADGPVRASEARDLRVNDSSLQLASFAHAELHNEVFERVNLAEASFMGARLDGVGFVDCRLIGADFRGAKLSGCEIRGASLDGVIGIESLGGVRMPWPDVLGSAAALAAALGIAVEEG